MSRHIRTPEDPRMHLLERELGAVFSLGEPRIVCGANVRLLLKDSERKVENATIDASACTCAECFDVAGLVHQAVACRADEAIRAAIRAPEREGIDPEPTPVARVRR